MTNRITPPAETTAEQIDDQLDDRRFTIRFSTSSALLGLNDDADPIDPDTAFELIRDRLDDLERDHHLSLVLYASDEFGTLNRDYVIRGYTPGRADTERLADIVQREIQDIRFAIERGDPSEIDDR